MGNRVPVDGFEYYYSLGESRSYQAVAEKYGVTKRAVCNVAAREKWQEQVTDRDRQVRENLGKRCMESLDDMTQRHLKQLRVIQHRAVEALRSMPLTTAMEAVRALGLAIKEERAVRCGPDNEGDDIEAIIKREYERWMVPADADEKGGDDVTT